MVVLLGTKNAGKIREIQQILSDTPQIRLLSYQQHPFGDVVEDGATFAENARKKAQVIAQETGLPVLAEDSGLEVDALGGRPGVYSARFAHERATDRENVQKLLELMVNVTNRRARFRCVAVLCFPDGRELLGLGSVEGVIAETPRGSSGFGYDPVFIPDGYDKTMAELGAEVKNELSHRRQALEAVKGQLMGIL